MRLSVYELEIHAHHLRREAHTTAIRRAQFAEAAATAAPAGGSRSGTEWLIRARLGLGLLLVRAGTRLGAPAGEVAAALPPRPNSGTIRPFPRPHPQPRPFPGPAPHRPAA